jgi:hypothetical protein
MRRKRLIKMGKASRLRSKVPARAAKVEEGQMTPELASHETAGG